MKTFLGILSIFTLIYFQTTTATGESEKAAVGPLMAETETTVKQMKTPACEQQSPDSEVQDFTAILECNCKVRTRTERSASPYWEKTVIGEGITKDEQIVEAINDAIEKCTQIKKTSPDLYRSAKLTGCRKIELLPNPEVSED